VERQQGNYRLHAKRWIQLVKLISGEGEDGEKCKKSGIKKKIKKEEIKQRRRKQRKRTVSE
jgi:hypothetical protein